MFRIKIWSWLTVILFAIAIKLFSLFPDAVENYYSTGIYPLISGTQRIIFGWLPLSIGDIFYAFVFLYLLYHVILVSRKLIKRKADRYYLLAVLSRLVYYTLIVYVSFNILWGLNYNRRGMATQLNLAVENYSKDDLLQVMQQLIYRLNSLDSSAKTNRIPLRKKARLFNGAILSYEELEKQDPLFKYTASSVKPSLYSYLGNYLGFTGYYNPFSGEAQVNTTVPVFIRPFTTCHEIGHQLGYAKESEANFAGYLSGRSSLNPAFRYSVYFDLYSYARRYLYLSDSTKLKIFDEQLNDGVRQDYRELRSFLMRHENPFELIIDRLYSRYLQANQQPSGRMSYNEVVGMLIAYYKKFKSI